MKKLLQLLLLAFIIISCEGPIGPTGLQGIQGEPGLDGKDGVDGEDGMNGAGVNWLIRDFEIASDDWNRSADDDGLNGHYYRTINFPALSDFIYNNGTTIAYIEIAGRQQILPSVRHYESNNNEDYFQWTQTIDYDYSIGNLTFYVTNSDFFDVRPGTMLFRVVFMW